MIVYVTWIRYQLESKCTLKIATHVLLISRKKKPSQRNASLLVVMSLYRVCKAWKSKKWRCEVKTEKFKRPTYPNHFILELKIKSIGSLISHIIGSWRAWKIGNRFQKSWCVRFSTPYNAREKTKRAWYAAWTIMISKRARGTNYVNYV